jgi:septum site-determining protein MinD
MTRIIAVNSFRRGVGRSTIAANLAMVLALKGKRIGLIDANLQAPGLHVLFGQHLDQLTYSLNDFLQKNCDIHQAAYRIAPTDGGIDLGRLWLVPANPHLAETARMARQGYDLDWFDRGLQDLAGALQLDLVLIDTQHGLTEETLSTLAITDVLILLLRTDQQDYRGTAITVELARKLDIPRILLIVNEAPTTYDFATIKSNMAQTYDCEVVAILPHFEEVMALAGASLFVLHYPDHELSRQLKRVAAKLDSNLGEWLPSLKV